MKLIEFETLSEGRRAELEGDELDPWGGGDLELTFVPKDHHLGVEDEDGTLVAAAGTVVAEAQVSEARFPVLGIGGVIVRASFRGRGLARAVVEAVLERGRGLGVSFALLFCLPDRMGLYRKLGFTEVEGEVLVKQPSGGYQVMPMRTMWAPLGPDALWPSGPLVLHSLPF